MGDLRQLLSALWYVRLLLGATFLIVLGAAAGYLALAPESYTATAVIDVEPAPGLHDLSQFNDFANATTATLAQLATSSDVERKVEADLGGPAGEISSDYYRGTHLVWIEAKSGSPSAASRWANGLADALRAYNPSTGILVIRQVETAVEPKQPASPDPRITWISAVALSLVLASIITVASRNRSEERLYARHRVSGDYAPRPQGVRPEGVA